jgi:hypothetical protein
VIGTVTNLGCAADVACAAAQELKMSIERKRTTVFMTEIHLNTEVLKGAGNSGASCIITGLTCGVECCGG